MDYEFNQKGFFRLKLLPLVLVVLLFGSVDKTLYAQPACISYVPIIKRDNLPRLGGNNWRGGGCYTGTRTIDFGTPIADQAVVSLAGWFLKSESEDDDGLRQLTAEITSWVHIGNTIRYNYRVCMIQESEKIDFEIHVYAVAWPL